MNGTDLKSARGATVVVNTSTAAFVGRVARTTPTTIELVDAQDVTSAKTIELGGTLVIAAATIRTMQIRGA